MQILKQVLIGMTFSLALVNCSSAPKNSNHPFTEPEVKAWLAQYCSKGLREVTGDLRVNANTRDFQGQFPASFRAQAKGGFVLEVTSIIGGTLFRLSSDGKTLNSWIPMKPKYNQSGMSEYLGMGVPILTELMMGDIPCPPAQSGPVKLNNHGFELSTASGRWVYETEDHENAQVPARIRVLPHPGNTAKAGVEMQIEDWNRDEHYAKKVKVKSADGELRWTWRNRETK